MTRKDYEMLAATLKFVRQSYAPHWDKNLFRACDDHARTIATAIKSEKPAFDVKRFLSNAGVPPT